MRGAFVVCQFAVALVLLAGAGLLIRSLLAVQSVDSGFGDVRVVMAHLRFNNALPRERRTGLYQGAMDRIRQLPGVRTVGAIGTMFWDGDGGKFGLRAVDGHADKPRDQWESLTWTTVSGDYFQALGVPLLRGRFFRDTDTRNAPPVVLINETMARRYWPGEDPIGHRIKGFDARGTNDERVTVIGVVKDSKYSSVHEQPTPFFFVPLRQNSLRGSVLNIRTPLAPQTMATAIAREVHSLDPNVAPYEVITMQEQLDRSTSPQMVAVTLVGVLGGLALLLAAIGLYGVISYAVNQSTRELGLRIALGASGKDLLRLVFSQAFVLVITGVVIGTAAALGLTRLMGNLLYKVSPRDPAAFGLALLVITISSFAAVLVPALRAAGIDPARALRE